MKLEEFLNCEHDIDCNSSMTRLYCQKCGQDANVITHVKKLQKQLEIQKDVVSWAQCTLTGLNIGNIQSESPIHLKLREVMIKYREELRTIGEIV